MFEHESQNIFHTPKVKCESHCESLTCKVQSHNPGILNKRGKNFRQMPSDYMATIIIEFPPFLCILNNKDCTIFIHDDHLFQDYHNHHHRQER